MFLCAVDVKQPSIVDAFSKPKPASKTSSKKTSSLDSSDSEGGAKAPAATKPKAVAKRKQAETDDSDSDCDDLMSRIRAKTTAGTKVGSHERTHRQDFEVFRGFRSQFEQFAES